MVKASTRMSSSADFPPLQINEVRSEHSKFADTDPGEGPLEAPLSKVSPLNVVAFDLAAAPQLAPPIKQAGNGHPAKERRCLASRWSSRFPSCPNRNEHLLS
jgi:hypothetical protein